MERWLSEDLIRLALFFLISPVLTARSASEAAVLMLSFARDDLAIRRAASRLLLIRALFFCFRVLTLSARLAVFVTGINFTFAGFRV